MVKLCGKIKEMIKEDNVELASTSLSAVHDAIQMIRDDLKQVLEDKE